jgi:hypothetical protein
MIYLTSDEIRDLLNECYVIKRDGLCIECNGTGYQNWNEDGLDVQSGYYSGIDRVCGECESCSGIGYLF